MIKLFTSKEIKAWDAATIHESGITSFELMQRACRAFVAWFTERYDASHRICIVCGTGNNGGDGLGIALLLHEWNYTLSVVIVQGNKIAPDFEASLKLVESKINVKEISTSAQLPADCSIIIDALFGTGLSRDLTGLHAEVVKKLNELDAIKIAVDVPSGLRVDSPSLGEIFRADYTLTFQTPKLGFLLPQNNSFVGEWHVVDIDLSKTFFKGTPAKHLLVNLRSVKRLIKPRKQFSHKGDYGHAILIAGSTGKMGAAVLAARAALRAGVGLLTVHVPANGNVILQTAVPEAMTTQDQAMDFFSGREIENFYSAIGIGPGLGQAPETILAFEQVLEQASKPMVLDADALNILANKPTLLSNIPAGCILTPHPGEFKRLVGEWQNDFDKLDLLSELSKKLKAVILLKGAHSAIALPEGSIYFNATGNPGMATGGSGDVLTGILTSLLAQGYGAAEAAIIGVYVHGLAGDMAACEIGETGLIAGDLIKYLPAAFKRLV